MTYCTVLYCCNVRQCFHRHETECLETNEDSKLPSTMLNVWKSSRIEKGSLFFLRHKTHDTVQLGLLDELFKVEQLSKKPCAKC